MLHVLERWNWPYFKSEILQTGWSEHMNGILIVCIGWKAWTILVFSNGDKPQPSPALRLPGYLQKSGGAIAHLAPPVPTPMYRPTSASIICSESSESKSPAKLVLLEAIHVELWASYLRSGYECAHDYILVKVSFQYLIPNKSYNKPYDLKNQP